METKFIRHRVTSVRKMDEALSEGYAGVELDIRVNQLKNRLVVSHDAETADDGVHLEDFFYSGRLDEELVILLDLKENGIIPYLEKIEVPEWVNLFVMGIPGMELKQWEQLNGLGVCISRISEYEHQQAFHAVLIDSFDNRPTELLRRHKHKLLVGKKLFIIGPDLRGAKAYKEPLEHEDYKYLFRQNPRFEDVEFEEEQVYIITKDMKGYQENA